MLQRRPFIAQGLALGAATLLPAAWRPAFAAVAVGQPAPDFTLQDTAGQPVKLSQFKSKPVVLAAFRPPAWPTLKEPPTTCARA